MQAESNKVLGKGSVVVFAGDSITHAFRKPDETIDAYQLGAGFVLMLAAQMMCAGTDDAPQFYNRGVCGKTVRSLRRHWQSSVLALKPTLISLLVGINDVGQEVAGDTTQSPSQFERDYRALLQRSRASLPGVDLVLCEPFALPCGRVEEGWLRPLRQRQRIVASLAHEFDAVFVPLQSHFDVAARKTSPTHWIHDGIHPTAAGHRLIADAWLRAVRRQMTRPNGSRRSVLRRSLARPATAQAINLPIFPRA